MKQVQVKVQKNNGEEVVKIAENSNAKNISLLQENNFDFIILQISNRDLQQLLENLELFEEAEISIGKEGIIALYPPQNQVPESVTKVQPKSSIEIYLSGLQSIGSFTGFIGFTITSAIIVWIGLYTSNLIYIIAGMLVSPLAGPAMNAALGAAAGDVVLFKRSFLRYSISLAISMVMAAVFSLVFQQKTASTIMLEISHISYVVAVLPIVAGIAGAVTLIQSKNDSLVSGTAVGVLVAASLAPPASILGMSMVFGGIPLTQSAAFILSIQLVGILLSATVTFRFYGKITHKGIRFHNGTKSIFRIVVAITVILLPMLVYYQFTTQPQLQKGSLKTKIVEIIESEIKDIKEIKLIETQAIFPRSEKMDFHPVICKIALVRTLAGANAPNDSIKAVITKRIRNIIQMKKMKVQPAFDVTFLD